MTTKMIRKQFYITREQQIKLHDVAEHRGISESEVIRRIIDNENLEFELFSTEEREAAFDELMKEASKDRGLTGKPYHFNREEIYQERESRWLRGDK